MLFTSFKTPYDIAFTGIDISLSDRLPDYFVDAFFFIDAIIIMNSAFYNDEVYLIDDRKIILDNIKRYNNNIVTILFGNNSINDENILSHKFAKDWNDVIKIISETAYFEVMPNEDIDIEKMLSLKYYPENNKQINKEDYMTFD